jgi:hypothetical protein
LLLFALLHPEENVGVRLTTAQRPGLTTAYYIVYSKAENIPAISIFTGRQAEMFDGFAAKKKAKTILRFSPL